MPLVRGKFIPEIKSTGNAKRSFDVLFWLTQPSTQTLRDLDEIDVLRFYLHSLRPSICAVEFLVPTSHAASIAQMRSLNIHFKTIDTVEPTDQMQAILEDKQLAEATQTALAYDVDTLVVTEQYWFPYIQVLETLGIFLSDTHLLKHRCELFSRGHDAPWAFAAPVWNMKWTGFYQLSEPSTVNSGLELLQAAQKKNVNLEAQEVGRSLVHNRLPNICFTRDRLLFYEIQKLAAVRRKWNKQQFHFEVAYYLNFYYPLLWGGFDHAALLVNNFLRLGIKEKAVGATRANFLNALRDKNPALYAVFTETKHTTFMKRIGALRHYALHRGSVQPAKVIEKPDKGLTDEEVDAMIAKAHLDYLVTSMPEGDVRDNIQSMLRLNFRMQHYENIGTVAESIVGIELDGKQVLIHPSSDIYWNYQRFMLFLEAVFDELKKTL
jgi:hypothetical protein